MQIERYIARESERDAAVDQPGGWLIEESLSAENIDCSAVAKFVVAAALFSSWPGSQSHWCDTWRRLTRRRSPLLLLLLSSRRVASRVSRG